LGSTVATCLLPDRYGISTTHTFQLYVEPKRMTAAYCTPHAGEIFIFFMYQAPQSEHVPREQRLSRLREALSGMGWRTEQFLADISPTQRVFMDAVVQIQMPHWHKGRVALVGDACYCPTLLSGQGASLAMGGAYLLARALHDAGDYEQAFGQYEQRMFGFVQAQQKNGRSFAKSFLPGSPLGLFVQRTMMKLLLRPMFRGLLRRQFGAETLVTEPPAPRAADGPCRAASRSRAFCIGCACGWLTGPRRKPRSGEWPPPLPRRPHESNGVPRRRNGPSACLPRAVKRPPASPTVMRGDTPVNLYRLAAPIVKPL
jgi:hypothetical protein